MAIDVYLQIDGIKGESQDDKHKDWIECASVNWGLTPQRDRVDGWRTHRRACRDSGNNFKQNG
jgi:type VI protein secretion system component Hcp